MLSKGKENSSTRRVDTLLGKDFNFKGSIEASSGALRIDGYFEGDIIIEGDLIVGETGSVTGNITAKNITVAGEIKGHIESRGKLELTPTAKVMADAKMGFLIVEDGAFMQGQCEPLPRGELKERGKALFSETIEE